MRRNSANLILCLGEIVIGALLLVHPVGFTRSIIMALGAVLALVGLFNIFRYFRTPHQSCLCCCWRFSEFCSLSTCAG